MGSPSLGLAGYTREQERYFSNEFFVRAKLRHHSLPNDDDYAGWLALMQHYGLPTRLLDWTRSPLVAAFFATEAYQRHAEPATELAEGADVDACIWALAPGTINSRQGFEEYLLPLNANQLRELITPSRKGRDTRERVAAAMAIETDLRMQMQQGAFTVHSLGTPLNRIAGCDEWLRQYMIPKAQLPSMARQLDLLGFRLGDLFPDLVNLAKELKGRHRPQQRAVGSGQVARSASVNYDHEQRAAAHRNYRGRR
jgi:hypothetical protein